MRVFQGLAGAVIGLAWSADGRVLAEARSGPVITLRDLSTGVVMQTWDESHGQVPPDKVALAFGPEGALYAQIGTQVLRYQGLHRTKLFGFRPRSGIDGERRPQLSLNANLLLTGEAQGMDLLTRRRLPVPVTPAWTVDDISLAAVGLAPDGQTAALGWTIDNSRQLTLALGLVRVRSGHHLGWLTQGELPPADKLWFDPQARWIYSLSQRPRDRSRLLSALFVGSASSGFVLATQTRTLRLPIPGRARSAASLSLADDVGCISFSRDHRQLFNAGGNIVETYRAVGDAPEWLLDRSDHLPLDNIRCLAPAADGCGLAVGDRLGQIALIAT